MGLVLAGATLLLAGLLWFGESRGWPFLAQPAERWLAQRLGRTVSFAGPADAAAGVANTFHLTLLGRPQLQLAHATVGNASWGRPGPLLDIQGLQLQWHWGDLWQAYARQRPLRVQALLMDSLALQLERRADGHTNWQSLLPPPLAANTTRANTPAVQFERLQLGHGSVRLDDAQQQLDLLALLSVRARAAPSTDKQPSTAAEAVAAADAGLQLTATGHYRQLPLRASLHTGPALPLAGGTSPAAPVQVQLHAEVGRARLDFTGQVLDPFSSQGLRGRYTVSGPSLAAVGEPLRLTLPATRAFAMNGRLVRQGSRWFSVVDKATVGSSRLAGEFTFDTPTGAVPSLTGRLHGATLLLQDLGPALGLPTEPAAADPRRQGRVLPDRRFDLPSLRAMNANILVRLDRLDPGTQVLQPVAPLQAHLLLQGGVLDLQDIDAHLAQGRIRGRIQLDGRATPARWQAQLAGNGLDLAQWITPLQRKGGAPWASGRLGGQLDVQGQGRSTAELLASADGHLLLHWTQGSVSHLAVEAAGLDLAQGLGLLLRGDDNLPVTCGAGDLLIHNGLVTPRVLMVDTRDSTLWADGTLSLATERLALTAHVAPKDWSPLALRSPLHLDGTLAQPVLSLDKPAVLKRLVPAALLALVNPLAALLPLVDLGGPGAGESDAAAAISTCRNVAARQHGQRKPHQQHQRGGPAL